MAYRILTLDGGGVWALVEVKTLIELFGSKTTGNQVLAQFDMVAANSGGSIVLGGLVEDVELQALLGYFMDEANRKAIFSPTGSVLDRTLEGLLHLGPKYSAAAKLPALEVLMPKTGNTTLCGIKPQLKGPSGDPVRLLVAGFDYDWNRGTWFRSSPVSNPCLGIVNAPNITLAEAIHASTNAPVNYFDGPASFPARTVRYWDGGISGHNNPVLAAVTEAMLLGVPALDIAALSLGTGTVRLPPGGQGEPVSPFHTTWQASGVAPDIGKIAASILDDPPDSASFIAHVMTGGATNPPPGAPSRIVRMNPLITPAAMDGQPLPPGSMSVAQFQYLCGIGIDALQPTEVNAIAAYTDLWIAGEAPNQPIHTDEGTPPVTIGAGTFATALEAWNAIK
jgi:hypothetical protein